MPNKSVHIPYRRCIGCMQSKPQSELIRIACPDGILEIDGTGRMPGRGAYICKSKECTEKAIKRRAFQRILKSGCTDEVLQSIVEALKEAL